MKVENTSLPGVLLVVPVVHGDSRGSFRETWQQARYAAAGLPEHWVQDNASVSRRGVLRGLHYQHAQPQGKLVTVMSGEILDVAVDVRAGSPTFGRCAAVTLSSENARQLWIPEGFAHGFVVLSERAVVHYKVTRLYDAASERTILWNDPDIGIDWPVSDPILSDKDAQGKQLADFRPDELPVYRSLA